MQNTLGNYIDAFFLTIVLYVHSSYSLYEDQIGKFDWQQQYLGYVTRTFLGKVIDGSKQIIVMTEQNVIASLKLESGDITWKKVFEKGIDGNIDTSVINDNKLLTLYGNQSMIRIWDILSSYIIDEISLDDINERQHYNIIVDNFNSAIIVINEKVIKYYLFYPKWKEMWETINTIKDGTSDLWKVLIDQSTNTLNIMQTFKNSFRINSYDLITGQFLSDTELPLTSSIRQCVKTKKTMICLTNSDGYNAISFLIIDVIKRDNSIHLDSTTISVEDLSLSPDSNSKLNIINPESNYAILMSVQNSNGLYVYRILKTGQSNYKFEQIFKDLDKNIKFHLEQRGSNYVLTIVKLTTDNKYLVQFYHLEDEASGRFELESKVYQPLHIQLPNSCKDIREFEIVFADQPSPHIQSGSRIRNDSYYFFIQTSDYALMLFDSQGQIVWIREEALAYIRTAEMIDLPVADKQALSSEQGYLDYKSKHPFIPISIVTRIYFQMLEIFEEAYKCIHTLQIFKDPSRFLAHLLQQSDHFGSSPATTVNAHAKRKHFAEYYDPQVLSNPDQPTPTLYRDEFNLRKLIVVSTEIGKIFGLDSKTGKIVYSFNVPDLVPFGDEEPPLDPLTNTSYAFFLLRTSSHYPLSPSAVVIGKDRGGRGGRILCFDPISGDILESLLLPYEIKQASLLPLLSHDFTKPVLLMDSQNKVHIYPANLSNFVSDYLSRTFMFTADSHAGTMTGYQLGQSVKPADDINSVNDKHAIPTRPVWSLNLQYNSQRIMSITPKRQSEQIDSPGKVLDDRNVLYKYVNPNLVAVVTECPEHVCPLGHFDIYLIDVIVGNVIYSAQHKKCHGPVYVVNSENWIFYTYYNVKQRRQEVSIIYLYQGTTLDNSTTLSSFTPPLDRAPMIEHRSFIFPYFPITALTTTFTELGLTQKKLIVALENGKLYEFSRESLDQRYSFQKSKDERVDFYVPELPFFTQQVINYNLSLLKIRGFYVSPSGLESTSLVFAYGLDLYSTRITPSNHFDALKDDFDAWIIVAVLLALIVLSLITRSLASRKELNMAWS